MAEETILLDVKFDASKAASEAERLAEQIADLKKQQADLNAEFKAGTISSGEYAKASDDIKTKTSNLTKEMKGLFAQIRETDKATEQRTGSLNEERAALANMLKAYDSLSAAERDNEEIGGALLKNIQEQTDKVQNLEKATGRHQRNVGNYPSALQPAIAILDKMGISLEDLSSKGVGAFSKIGEGAKAFGKTMLTPPVGLIVAALSAIMLVLAKLSEAFKKSDDAGTKMAVALSALKPITEFIRGLFDRLANVVGDLAVGFANAVINVSAFIDRLRGTESQFTKSAKSAAELVKEEDALEDAERKYTLKSAERNKQIAKYRDLAAQAGDPKERKKNLKIALTFEENNLKDEMDIATRRHALLVAKAEQDKDTSDATKDAITEARVAMTNAETNYYNKRREVDGQLRELDTRIANDAKTRANASKAEFAEKQAQLKAQAKTQLDIEDKLQDALTAAIKDEGERRIAERQIQGEREIRNYQRQLEEDETLTEESRARLAELILTLQEQLDAELSVMREEAADEMEAKELERQRNLIDLKMQIVEEGSEEEFALRMELLDVQMQEELAKYEEGSEERMQIDKNYTKFKEDLLKEQDQARRKYELMEQAELAAQRKMYLEKAADIGSSMSGVFSALNDLVNAYGENTERAAKMQKVAAVAQLIIDQATAAANTAVAITAAVEGALKAAAETGIAAPFTAPVFVAEMVAIVTGAVASSIAGIVQAKQIVDGVDTGKFAGGGIIGGTSFEGDRLQANVNSGEMIINREQQSRLFDIANGGAVGGFDYSAFASAVAGAVAAQPAPIVAFSEFDKARQKTIIYKNIARL